MAKCDGCCYLLRSNGAIRVLASRFRGDHSTAQHIHQILVLCRSQIKIRETKSGERSATIRAGRYAKSKALSSHLDGEIGEQVFRALLERVWCGARVRALDCSALLPPTACNGQWPMAAGRRACVRARVCCYLECVCVCVCAMTEFERICAGAANTGITRTQWSAREMRIAAAGACATINRSMPISAMSRRSSRYLNGNNSVFDRAKI